jgi:8-oxo-dGTP pyrophosphatase MutT (NUDIX family)
MDNSAIKITIQDIKGAIKLDLPGEKAHRQMLPEGRSLDIPPEKYEKIKESAILILLFTKNDSLCICLTQRNTNLKHHPGQISFPGGQKEDFESTFAETALRELEEETGVKKETVELLGKLTDLYVPVSNFLIHPFIGCIGKEPKFSIDTQEVDEIITIPLNSFLSEENISRTGIKTHSVAPDVPCYKINDLIIWGATAMIIAEFTALLKNYYLQKAECSGNGNNAPTPPTQN